MIKCSGILKFSTQFLSGVLKQRESLVSFSSKEHLEVFFKSSHDPTICHGSYSWCSEGRYHATTILKASYSSSHRSSTTGKDFWKQFQALSSEMDWCVQESSVPFIYLGICRVRRKVNKFLPGVLRMKNRMLCFTYIYS